MSYRIALLALALTACSDSPFFGKSCTEIGCLNFIRVELIFDSDLSKDDIEVVVEHSGQSFSCDFGAELDPCHKGFGADFDPVSGPAMNDGRAIVLLNDTPDVLRITVTADGTTESQVVEPQYQRSQPNGPDCEPTCLSANTRAEFAL